MSPLRSETNEEIGVVIFKAINTLDNAVDQVVADTIVSKENNLFFFF